MDSEPPRLLRDASFVSEEWQTHTQAQGPARQGSLGTRVPIPSGQEQQVAQLLVMLSIEEQVCEALLLDDVSDGHKRPQVEIPPVRSPNQDEDHVHRAFRPSHPETVAAAREDHLEQVLPIDDGMRHGEAGLKNRAGLGLPRKQFCLKRV